MKESQNDENCANKHKYTLQSAKHAYTDSYSSRPTTITIINRIKMTEKTKTATAATYERPAKTKRGNWFT